jgi:hypothetical protein
MTNLEHKIEATAMQITDKMSDGMSFTKAVTWTFKDYFILEVPNAEALVEQAAQWLILVHGLQGGRI